MFHSNFVNANRLVRVHTMVEECEIFNSLEDKVQIEIGDCLQIQIKIQFVYYESRGQYSSNKIKL